MKKRIISTILAICSVFSLLMMTSCGKVDTYTMVDGAMAKTSALDEYSATLEIKISMTTDGFSMDIPMKAEVVAKDVKTTSPKVFTKITTSAFGFSVENTAYLEDGWFYIVDGTDSYKISAEDSMDEYDYLGDIEDMYVVYTEDMFEGVTPVDDGNGGKKIEFTVTAEQFSVLFEDMIEEIAGAGSSDGEAPDIDIGVDLGQIGISMTIKDDYITEYAIKFALTMTEEGVTSSISADMKLTYSAPGAPVTITPPEGYQNFEEYDSIFDDWFDDDDWDDDLDDDWFDDDDWLDDDDWDDDWFDDDDL